MKRVSSKLVIRHLWFDFSETIVFLQPEKHNELRYGTYAEVVKKQITKSLKAEYEVLYKEHKQSNAAIFRSLGMSAVFGQTE